MYYLELLQRFWNFNSNHRIGCSAISLYLYLLKTGNDQDRFDFSISDLSLGKLLGLSRKTIKSAREKLEHFGIIEFQTKNGTACSYRLLINYPEVQIDYHCKKELPFNLCAKQTEHIDNSAKKNNNQLSADEELSLIKQSNASTQIALVISTKNHHKDDIPTMQEFLEYAQQLDSYNPELYLPLQEKYVSWANNNWQNSSNRLITKWKFSLRALIPYMLSDKTDEGKFPVSKPYKINPPKVI